MAKRIKRWPIWKIAGCTVLCAAGSGLLFWLSAFLERVAGPAMDASRTTAMLTLPTFVMMLGVAVGLLTVLGVIWLVARIRDARIPPWEKRDRKRHR